MSFPFRSDVWKDIGDFTRNIEWPVVLGVLFMTMLAGLMIAVSIRYHSRSRLLSRSGKSHFTSRVLPVAYLSKTGELKDMMLTPSQFIVFNTLYHKTSTMKHGMCTDDTSWVQFCLFAAAEAFQRLSSSGQFRQQADDDETVDDLVISSIASLEEPYIRYLFSSKTDVSAEEVEGALLDVQSSGRGVTGLQPVADLAERNISVVSI
uniref:Uncharacterized protein n=1 Tax=Chionoecetes opilio bacilliform virus TaxID=1825681 RepID=A0A1Q3DLA0_9VIRU|nr:wsv021-like protein [Chionoecetes opilio bacilliform virus]GAV93155.1 hypothetical protein SCV_031 [Chionoecetes opilio bacilliform virus]